MSFQMRCCQEGTETRSRTPPDWPVSTALFASIPSLNSTSPAATATRGPRWRGALLRIAVRQRLDEQRRLRRSPLHWHGCGRLCGWAAWVERPYPTGVMPARCPSPIVSIVGRSACDAEDDLPAVQERQKNNSVYHPPSPERSHRRRGVTTPH
jgi:hypothetical protein